MKTSGTMRDFCNLDDLDHPAVGAPSNGFCTGCGKPIRELVRDTHKSWSSWEFIWAGRTPYGQRFYGFDFGPFAVGILKERKECLTLKKDK